MGVVRMGYRSMAERLKKKPIPEDARKARVIADNRIGIGRNIEPYKEMLKEAANRREELSERNDPKYMIDQINVRRVERARMPPIKDEIIGKINELARKKGADAAIGPALEAMKDYSISADRFNLPLKIAIQKVRGKI